MQAKRNGQGTAKLKQPFSLSLAKSQPETHSPGWARSRRAQGLIVSNFPQPAVLRLLATRETLAQQHARWPRTATSRARRQGGSNSGALDVNPR
jgi:hypothetical protein